MRRSATLLLLLASLSPRIAQGANEDDFFAGNEASLVAGAVCASVSDGSALFYNPAGLAAVAASRLDVTTSAYTLRHYKAPSYLRTTGGVERPAQVTELVVTPTGLGYVRRLSERISAGVGYFVPSAESALLRARFREPQDQPPVTSTTFALDARLGHTRHWIGAGLALRPVRAVRIGFGLFGSYEESENSISVFNSTAGDAGPITVLGASTLETRSTLSLALNLGLQAELTRRLTLGLSAMGPRLQVARWGETTVQAIGAGNELSLIPLTAYADSTSEGDRPQVGPIDMGRLRAGLSYRAPSVVVSGEFDLQPGLEHAATDVARRTTWNARAGVLYMPTEAVHLGVGLFTDRQTDASDDDIDFYGLTFGGQWNTSLDLAENEAASQLVFITVLALRYAYGAGYTSVVVGDTETGTLLVPEGERSRMFVHELGIHLGSGLQF